MEVVMNTNMKLREQLKKECNFVPSDEVVDAFLAPMQEISVKPQARLIDYGRVNSDVY